MSGYRCPRCGRACEDLHECRTCAHLDHVYSIPDEPDAVAYDVPQRHTHGTYRCNHCGAAVSEYYAERGCPHCDETVEDMFTADKWDPPDTIRF